MNHNLKEATILQCEKELALGSTKLRTSRRSAAPIRRDDKESAKSCWNLAAKGDNGRLRLPFTSAP
jgi:hypothetical protein